MGAAARFKTYVCKPTHHEGGAEKQWILVDAENAVVGRLATFLAMRLRGKHRPDYTPHVDCGDHVIVVNAEKVVFTGRKMQNKTYYRHTGYPGGVKSTTPARILESKRPERVLKLAVERMLPKEGALARTQLANLRIYAGPAHPHEAQKPTVVDFKGRSAKNVRVG